MKPIPGMEVRQAPSVVKQQHEEEVREQWRAGKEIGLISTTKTMGKGLFADAELPRGTYIGEYLGKEVREEAVVQKYFDNPPSNYCFFWLENGEMIMRNAKVGKNKIRFMNHAKRGSNCKIRLVDLDGRLRPLMFTIRLIHMGEQCLWDYGERDKKILLNHKFLSQ